MVISLKEVLGDKYKRGNKNAKKTVVCVSRYVFSFYACDSDLVGFPPIRDHFSIVELFSHFMGYCNNYMLHLWIIRRGMKKFGGELVWVK